MLGFALVLGLVGILVMVVVTIPATREGRGPWTWWARRRAERAHRLAERPVPTAEERFARGYSLRRVVGAVLHALPHRRPRATRFVEADTHRSVAEVSAQARAIQAARARAAAQARADRPDAEAVTRCAAPARPLREKVDERAYVAQVEAQADTAGQILVMVKKRIPAPEVIEADPIDADVVNPRILSRSR